MDGDHNLDGDITTTAVSKMDTRRLSIRDDTSCHRRYLEGQHSNQQLAWTSTATSFIAGATTSYLARGMTDDRQLLRQQLHAPPWSDHWQHRPGHQHHQEQQTGQRQEKEKEKEKEKGKEKERKAKARATTKLQLQLQPLQPPLQQLLQPTTTSTTTKKEQQKGKGPLGATTTRPARARTSRGKGKNIKGDKNNNKGKGKSTLSTATTR